MYSLETCVPLDILKFTMMTDVESKHDATNEKSGHKIRNNNDAKSDENDNMLTYDEEEKFSQQSFSVLSMYYESGNK